LKNGSEVNRIAPKKPKKVKFEPNHYTKFLEYPRNFRGLFAYGFAHAKVKKSILNPKILEFVDDIGIILNDV